MGGSHSRDGPELSDSDEYTDQEEEDEQSQSEEEYATPNRNPNPSPGVSTPQGLDSLDRKLKSLHLKYSNPILSPNPNSPNPNPSSPTVVKLYLHVGGSAPSARWVPSDKFTTFSFSHRGSSEEEESDSSPNSNAPWCLVVGSKIRAPVGPALQLKTFAGQKRVDFVADGVWAIKFLHPQGYVFFLKQYQDCLFENTYGVEATEENKVKVYGKEFIGWAKPDAADDSIWEDAKESSRPNHVKRTPRSSLNIESRGPLEEFEEEAAAELGIQSLALGALDNSFLVGKSGIQVVKNFSRGVHGKGVAVKFSGPTSSTQNLFSTPKKALLMRAETNMLLMSPANEGKPHTTGVNQIDIETGKVVTQWKFEKDGADITMRDITNDSKGAQLDPSESTFLGLDDNRLCRWDMRDRHGIVQDLANSVAEAPVLNWTQGHQFARGTNFQCFASTGDGSIVVGSIDGKIR
jgi:VID27 C-terminal WD40-like domain